MIGQMGGRVEDDKKKKPNILLHEGYLLLCGIQSNLSFENAQRTKECGLLTQVNYSEKCTVGGLK